MPDSARLGVPSLRALFEHVFDEERKIVKALEALGPVAGRPAVLIGEHGRLERELVEIGSDVRVVGLDDLASLDDGGYDVLIAAFTGFQGEAGAGDFAAAERVIRPGGRLLVLQDYARDDASKLLHSAKARADRIAWSRGDGWFIVNGFKLRVIHCWWTWASTDQARADLESWFGDDGSAIAAGLQRPRIEHKVAIYHRTTGTS